MQLEFRQCSTFSGKNAEYFHDFIFMSSQVSRQYKICCSMNSLIKVALSMVVEGRLFLIISTSHSKFVYVPIYLSI